MKGEGDGRTRRLFHRTITQARYPLVVKELQKGATPESIIPRLVKSGLTSEDALELVNIAIDEAGAIIATPEVQPPRRPYETPAAQVRPGTPTNAEPFVTSAQVDYSGMYASFFDKLVAVFIDGIILMVIMVPIFFLMGMETADGWSKKPQLFRLLLYVSAGVHHPARLFRRPRRG